MSTTKYKFIAICLQNIYNTYKGGDNMDLGNKVKSRRESLGMSQEELAIKMGYKSRSSINKIENGRAVTQKIIYRLAEALNTTPAYLLGWDENKEETSQKIDATTDIIIRMEKDKNFSELVQMLYKMDSEKIVAVKTMLNSFL